MRTRAVAWLLGAIALATAAAVLAGCGASAGADRAERRCNGLASLCQRRLDQVVFPGTHNSFAAADEPGWHFANQRFGIGRQLEDGIRALLLDVHYGVPDPARGLVRTDFAAEGAESNKALAAAPPAARQLAERLAGPLGAGLPPGPPRLYLCHTLCELGAEPLGRELGAIGAFLAAHRRQALVLIVEDYVPERDLAAAFRRAGLAALAAPLPRHGKLPTLGGLLDGGKQLLVFSEKQGGQPAWLMPAFDYIQDTPLGARRPDQLSCARYRGEPDSPLLLVNHWIPPFPPSPRLNAAIGGSAYLGRRLRTCLRERGFAGAIVAVDFYERTAVVAVARRLNRLPAR